ncbi:right-handed parallel beta-helix repeat-containing protein [Paenibacillus sp. N1-5-1-14]|uniref:right-handed parallel beta-helix repeat-containing protein n=1 Tax=Paenibacillus radicibacter TaxID=2972488 RepID=UPI002158FADE|nr:NosD domain-containing protein [Paenibacillus radicibacter]MCR8645479.1 right-handed parallel beta-helix repeat-containing protein [Paenibacillus radicibacter]
MIHQLGNRLGAWLGCAVIMILIIIHPHAVLAEQGTSPLKLQDIVDRTEEGQTLILPAGKYEGPLRIHKAIAIEGNGQVEINGDSSSGPVVKIEANHVQLRGIAVNQPSDEEQSSAVLVTGNQAMIDSVMIYTQTYGIVVRDSGNHQITNNRIIWGQEQEEQSTHTFSNKRNGIDLYNSHENRIQENQISQMNDGIYLENSNRNRVENNRVDHSRYGIHCMYTNETIVRSNYGESNVTGAMIMGVHDAEVTDNTFVKQSENVNSQGILLFDVQTSRIMRNKVEGNRVGLYIEQSSGNKFQQNEVIQNFVGIQFLESNENRFVENHFIGNVIPSQTNESTDNLFERNYWEAFQGIDLDGNGMSDLPYAMNPFFQRLTADTPAFQLFFQSPGMQFLETMYAAGKEDWSTDTAPFMHLQTELLPKENQDKMKVGFLALFLLGVSMTIIIHMGVKRT